MLRIESRTVYREVIPREGERRGGKRSYLTLFENLLGSHSAVIAIEGSLVLMFVTLVG